MNYFSNTNGAIINRIDLTVKRASGSTETYNYTSYDYVTARASQTNSFVVPAGEQFIGFSAGGTVAPASNWGVFRAFAVVTRSATAMPKSSACFGLPDL